MRGNSRIDDVGRRAPTLLFIVNARGNIEYVNDRWTTGRLAKAIEKQFGIRYDQDHVGRLMHKYGLRARRFVYAPVDTYTAASVAAA